jgi:NO-binding membrane sensor protein with MHYT domain
MMRALWIVSGVAVWALHFMAIYGFTALACARGFPSAIPWAIAIATVLATALAVAIVARHYPRRSEFVHWMTATVAALALLAIVFEALPALWLPACGALRGGSWAPRA